WIPSSYQISSCPFFGISCRLSSTFSFSSSSSSLQTLPNSQSKYLSNPLYSFLPSGQNPANIVNLIKLALKQGSAQLSLLQNDIKFLISHLGSHEISRILLRCQSDSSQALLFFNWVKNDLGIKPSTHNYCLIVHILAWSKKYSLAMNFLHELIQFNTDNLSNEDVFQSLVLGAQECNWDPVIFDMLIRAYVKVDMIREAYGAFRKTIQLGFTPTVIACNHLLNGLLKLNCIDKCWQVHELMGRFGIRRNSCTFNILTNALCKDADLDKVNEFLEKMEEEGFDPDLVTYNTLISNYCRKRRLGDAFYLYRIMYRRRVMPDLVSYTALMNGLCKEGKVKEAHQLFHRMIHRGITPDVVSYNTLICSYSKEGRMAESRSLLYEMIGNGFYPDDFTCWTLVEGYAREGRLLSALNLVVELQRFRVSITRDIYDYLIVSLCNEDRPFAAKSLLERISHNGYMPKLEICNELIGSFCKNDSVTDALYLKAEMENWRTKANLVTYRVLISCLCRLCRNAEAESLMEEMLESGLLPDLQICRDLIKGYCKGFNVDKAESLLCFFAKEFHIFDNESYNTLARIFSELGDVPKLMQLQEGMLKLGFTPNSLTCKYLIQGLWKEVGLNRVLK
ncbi:pentatricopeptide repeat-containing protein At5g40400, partial [Carica papaya]|uniref:pentatricopeptide repeat-containing protein At5g40400 n=1 Tax=Carica papaya TaxID=3649 RepID=UPI000B8CAB8C